MGLRLRSLGFLTITLAFGCTETEPNPTLQPIGHENAALTVRTNTDRMLRGLIESASHLTDSQTLARVLTALSGDSGSCSTSVAAPCPTGATDCVETPIVDDSCTSDSNEVTVADLGEVKTDLLEATDEFNAFLRDEVFIDANLESDDGKTVIYRLGPNLLCNSDASGAVPTAPAGTGTSTATGTSTTTVTETLDPECVANVEKLVPKLELTSVAEGDIDIAVVLTEQRIIPARLHAYRASLSVDVDLGALQQASNVADVPLEGVKDLAGSLSGSLIENGSLDYTFELSVNRALSMLFGDETPTINLKLAESPKALSVNFNGNTRRTQGSVDLKAFELSGPMDSFYDRPETYDANGNVVGSAPYTGTISASLAGLHGKLAYESASDVFSFSDIGIGNAPFVMKHDSDVLVSVEANAAQNHTFDMSLEPGDPSGPTVSFSSGLELDVVLGFAAVANQLTDIESFLLKDSLKLAITGNAAQLKFEDGQVRVLKGSVGLQSLTYGTYQTVAQTGMCLVSADAEEPPTFAAFFAANTCEAP